VEAATRGDPLPRPGHVRTTRRLKRDRISLSLSLSISFPAQSFVSRKKYRLAPVHHISIPPFIIFLFCYGGRRGGDGEQQYILFCHDVEIFPPKMTKK
jgi:hypothetical protein